MTKNSKDFEEKLFFISKNGHLVLDPLYNRKSLLLVDKSICGSVLLASRNLFFDISLRSVLNNTKPYCKSCINKINSMIGII